MSYIETVSIKASDSPTIDAFARLRVSDPFTIFDSKQIYDSQNLFWANKTTNGGVVELHDAANAKTTLSVTTTGDEVIRQTKQYFNYQPGKSQLSFITGLFSKESDVEKEVGLFDDDNGISLFVDSVTDVSWRITKGGTPTETATQSNWNIDKFDGTGPSGLTLDLNQTQIIYIDFEWLGVGRVRCGFVIDGIPYVAHEFLHANQPGNSTVYMSNPNLPVRYRIKSNGSAGSLDHICSSIISEGGQQQTGILRSFNTGDVVIEIGTTEVPVLAFRHQSGKEKATLIDEYLSIMSSSNSNFKWTISHNATSSVGTDFTTGFTAMSNSTLEYKNAFSGNITDNGTVIASGYGSNNTDSATFNINSFLRVGYDIGTATSDVWVLSIETLGGTDDFHAALTYREIV
jgi:hypothetical protein